MRKMSEITESVWSDIHRRSKGVQSRKEDDVNNMDKDMLFEYLENRYEPVPNSKWKDFIDSDLHKIFVTVLEPGIESYAYNITLEFPYMKGDDKKVILMSNDLLQDCRDIYKLLKDNYDLSYYSRTMFAISPVDKSEVTNKFYIDVIDFLIDNMTDDERKLIKRK